MARAAQDKPKKPATPTRYVVLRDMGYQDQDVYELLRDEDGNTLVTGATNGEAAIKQATLSIVNDEDVYAPGVYHAVPASTWESETNQLEIESETKLVTTFKRTRK